MLPTASTASSRRIGWASTWLVYVHAKKWEGSVGPGEIDKFVGSLSRKKAHKGVFITTGTFTSGALQAAREAAVRIVLMDGEQLAELMIDHGVGVADSRAYTVKKMDNDDFEEVSGVSADLVSVNK